MAVALNRPTWHGKNGYQTTLVKLLYRKLECFVQHSSKTRCSPNGTWPYCPAVQCRPPDLQRARPGGGQPPTRVTDDDRRRRQRAKQYWPIRRASNNSRYIISQFSFCPFTLTHWCLNMKLLSFVHTDAVRCALRCGILRHIAVCCSMLSPVHTSDTVAKNGDIVAGVDGALRWKRSNKRHRHATVRIRCKWTFSEHFRQLKLLKYLTNI